MKNSRKLLRLIVPAYSEFNIYTAIANKTTGLGLVAVASAANKLPGWEVEIIDENNCANRTWPPNAGDGHIDHRELQRLRPATIVGFYGSMSSCIPRIYKVAKIYQELGAITIVGGYHARSLPQDMLDNGLDLVALDGGEQSMIDLMRMYDLTEFNGHNGRSNDMSSNWNFISSVAFLSEGQMLTTKQKNGIVCHPWPLPDYSLMRYAKIKIYQINWLRGCPYNCEFCAVKEKVDFAPAEEFMARVEYLYEKFGARKFFIVDDHFGGNLEQKKFYDETIKLLKLLQEYQKRIGKRLSFTIQIRLNVAKKSGLLQEMKLAGIDNVCIGYESPIDDELIRMNKGYKSSDMIEWSRMWLKAGFFVHGMFIFGYPEKLEAIENLESDEQPKISIKERAAIYRRFIKESKISTAQVLLAVPLPGTELRARLEQEGRLYPLELIGWEEYDGQFPLYDPIICSPQELQEAMGSIMSRFYDFKNVLKLFFLKWCIRYPLSVFPFVITLAALRTNYIVKAHKNWSIKHHRNTLIRAGGWFIIRHWFKKYRRSDFPQRLKKAQEALDKNK